MLDSITDVPATQWDTLAGPTAPPFVRHAWLAAMEESGSAQEATGWAPHHLTLWRGERLVAASPGYLKYHSMGEYIYDFAWAQAASRMGVEYYPKLLLGAPLSPATAPRFLIAPGEDEKGARHALLEAALESAREESCSSVHVLYPTEEEADFLEGQGLARRMTLQFHWKNPGYRTYDDYLARFYSKRRHQLRRERAAAAEQGITLRTVPGTQFGPEHAKRAHDFYAATCERFAWGQVQLTPDFFARVFRALPESVELVEAVRNGKVIAGRLQPGDAGAAVRPLLGLLRGAPLPALQRVPVPLGGREHPRGPQGVRARRRRRAQGVPGLRAHRGAQRALPLRLERWTAPSATSCAGRRRTWPPPWPRPSAWPASSPGPWPKPPLA